MLATLKVIMLGAISLALIAPDSPAQTPIFVTVGGGGHRMSSSDGIHWKNHTQ